MLSLLRCFFAHLLILQYPDHHQNLISSSLYYSRPVHKISSQSVHNFLSNVVHRQTNKQTNKHTDRQTNQRYQKHNLLCQGGNKWKRDRTGVESSCTLNQVSLMETMHVARVFQECKIPYYILVTCFGLRVKEECQSWWARLAACSDS